MKKGIGGICKVLAGVLFILSSIVSGIVVHGSSVFLLFWAAGSVPCLMIYAIGEIAEQLALSNEKNSEMLELLRRLAAPAGGDGCDKASAQTLLAEAPSEENKPWVCKGCGYANRPGQRVCGGCGSHRAHENP